MDRCLEYILSTFVEQTRSLKRIGGHWNPFRFQVDGDKYICMDNLVQGAECIIYSFGISNDWSFEDMMDSAGYMI